MSERYVGQPLEERLEELEKKLTEDIDGVRRHVTKLENHKHDNIYNLALEADGNTNRLEKEINKLKERIEKLFKTVHGIAPDEFDIKDGDSCNHRWKIKENMKYGSYYHQCQICGKIIKDVEKEPTDDDIINVNKLVKTLTNNTYVPVKKADLEKIDNLTKRMEIKTYPKLLKIRIALIKILRKYLEEKK